MFYLYSTSHKCNYCKLQVGSLRNEFPKSTQLFVKANNVKVKTRNIYAYATVIIIIILTNRISIVASCACLIQRNENGECSEEITVKSLGIPHKHSVSAMIQHHKLL